MLQDGWGYDFRTNMSVAWEEYGNYATDVFTREAVKVIEVAALELILPQYLLYLDGNFS